MTYSIPAGYWAGSVNVPLSITGRSSEVEAHKVLNRLSGISKSPRKVIIIMQAYRTTGMPRETAIELQLMAMRVTLREV